MIKYVLLIIGILGLTACGQVEYVENRSGSGDSADATVVEESWIDKVKEGQDTDEDGLPDLDEIKYGTNAKVKDTDGGGVSDADEVANGTNPVDDPSDDLCCSSTAEFNLPNLEFIFDTDELTEDSKAIVQELVEKIQGLEDIKSVSVTGHTDSKGTDAYNQTLSEKRALAVKQILIADVPIEPSIIDSNGVGEMAPISGNETDEGRQRNRRVEVKITFK